MRITDKIECQATVKVNLVPSGCLFDYLGSIWMATTVLSPSGPDETPQKRMVVCIESGITDWFELDSSVVPVSVEQLEINIGDDTDYGAD